MVLLDLEKAIPSLRDDETLWNDKIHLNGKGYALMGKEIFDAGRLWLFGESVAL